MRQNRIGLLRIASSSSSPVCHQIQNAVARLVLQHHYLDWLLLLNYRGSETDLHLPMVTFHNSERYSFQAFSQAHLGVSPWCRGSSELKALVYSSGDPRFKPRPYQAAAVRPLTCLNYCITAQMYSKMR